MTNSNEKLLMEIDAIEKNANAVLKYSEGKTGRRHLQSYATRIQNAAKEIKKTVNAASPHDKENAPYVQVVVWDRDFNAETKIFCMSDNQDMCASRNFFSTLWDDTEPCEILLSVLDDCKECNKIFCCSIYGRSQVAEAALVVENIFRQFQDGAPLHGIISTARTRSAIIGARKRIRQNSTPSSRPFN